MTAANFQHQPEADFALDQDAEYDPDYDAVHDLAYDPAADRFDDSDGAYAVAEPDPFDQPPTVALRRPALPLA